MKPINTAYKNIAKIIQIKTIFLPLAYVVILMKIIMMIK